MFWLPLLVARDWDFFFRGSDPAFFVTMGVISIFLCCGDELIFSGNGPGLAKVETGFPGEALWLNVRC